VELITLALPTYLLRLFPSKLVPLVACQTLGHVAGVADHPARQTPQRCDGEARGDRRSRHRKGPSPYRD
jgi:hypothetical protein